MDPKDAKAPLMEYAGLDGVDEVYGTTGATVVRAKSTTGDVDRDAAAEGDAGSSSVSSARSAQAGRMSTDAVDEVATSADEVDEAAGFASVKRSVPHLLT